MKKCEFYSVHIEKGKKFVKLHSGYTDGTYNYYKAGFTWCAIVPDTGLAAVNDKITRSDTAQRAHSIEITDKYHLREISDDGMMMMHTVRKALEGIDEEEWITNYIRSIRAEL